MMESGYDQFVTASINFIVAPPGTPIAARQQLSKAVASALASAEVAQAFAKIGAQARPASPEELASYLTQQQLLWVRNVEATRISVD
jgi:tripartite-type tricarboxylate transporter receptor subunit TctC